MKSKIWLLISVLWLAGCATADINRAGAAKAVSPVLSAEQKICISLPKDGVYHNIKYDYSGQQVQQAFANALDYYGNEVVLADKELSVEDARAYAGRIGADVLVYPVITHWEDRNTPWSGMRDKVGITVQVYSIGANKMVDKTSLYATNRWFAFVNAAPANLLDKIVKPYIKQLY